jgi:phthalate 3,4-dioxygenase ferredoxin reductase subunit
VPTTLVIGTSIGGVRTAQALRAGGYRGDVVLIGEERCAPYDKPPLSKAVLAGTAGPDDTALLPDWSRSDVRLLLGRRAVRLDVGQGELELDDGQRLAYDDVVIATGATPRPSPWGSLSGVHVLRTLADAEALRADLIGGGHVVVIGGGFIGAEVAATARSLGLPVSLVDPLPALMVRRLGRDVGELFSALHQQRGVATHLGVGVRQIEGERGALRVTLTDGSVLDASVVVVGIGAVPNDGWLASSGLAVCDGVLCDEYGRALEAPRVHAVGDVARWWNPGQGQRNRVEHWTSAVEQASVVAHNIGHPDQRRAHWPVDYVWTDQYNWRIQIAGRTEGEAHHLVGEPHDDRFAVLYGVEGGPLTGLVTVNWPKALITGRWAVAAGHALTAVREALAETLPRPRPHLAADPTERSR